MVSLQRAVAASYNSLEQDVLALKRSLGDLGYYRPNPSSGWHGWNDRELTDAVRSFQADEGLEVDGVVNPDGPTVHRLNATAERKRRREDLKRDRRVDREAERARREAEAARAERAARIPSSSDLERQTREARTREEIARYLDRRRRSGHHMFWPFDAIETDVDRNPSRARSLFDSHVRNPDVMSHIRRGGK